METYPCLITGAFISHNLPMFFPECRPVIIEQCNFTFLDQIGFYYFTFIEPTPSDSTVAIWRIKYKSNETSN